MIPPPRSWPLAQGAMLVEEIGPSLDISLQDGKLSLLRLKHKPDALRPMTQDVFTGEIGTLRFLRDANEKVSGFILNAGRIRNLTFAKMAN